MSTNAKQAQTFACIEKIMININASANDTIKARKIHFLCHFIGDEIKETNFTQLVSEMAWSENWVDRINPCIADNDKCDAFIYYWKIINV